MPLTRDASAEGRAHESAIVTVPHFASCPLQIQEQTGITTGSGPRVEPFLENLTKRRFRRGSQHRQDSIDPKAAVAIVVGDIKELDTVFVHPPLECRVRGRTGLHTAKSRYAVRSTDHIILNVLGDRLDLLSNLFGEQANKSILVDDDLADFVDRTVNL